MLIVGESINGTIERVGTAIASRDEAFIRRLAREQVEKGAQMLDVNAGLGGRDEKEDLAWLVSVVQDEVGLPLVIDSSAPEAIEAALAGHQGRALVNSISAEREKQERLLPLLSAYDCGVVALCLTDDGIPKTAQERLAVARGLVEALTKAGKAMADIYLDPLVLTIATDWQAGATALETLRLFKQELSTVKTIAGLSNVGFGMPQRRLLNRTFLAMAMGLGLDGAILDVRDGSLMATLYAAQALAGQDRWCREYLKAYREERLQG
jgi:5-methyltetrahydrofolate--homocysteine methyltransferase